MNVHTLCGTLARHRCALKIAFCCVREAEGASPKLRVFKLFIFMVLNAVKCSSMEC